MRFKFTFGFYVLLGASVIACGHKKKTNDAGVELTDATTDAFDSSDALIASDGSHHSDAASCTPRYQNCEGLCGPVFDPCQGTLQCGRCNDSSKICNLDTHKCEAPIIGATDLQACAAFAQVRSIASDKLCGTIKDSCGTHHECGTCPEGQECNPDTNTCVTCSNPSCGDLGYQCGSAWLGCGPKTNLTDCGNCASLGTNWGCNAIYHVCENKCPPGVTKTLAQLCDTALLDRGVECGIISDGCGGVVNCGDTSGQTLPGFGCPTGFTCGSGGVANHCQRKDPPVECLARGRECGYLDTSQGDPLVCGTHQYCGDCPAGETCNTNGICGAPCTPKTCATALQESGRTCVRSYADGCGGTLNCGCTGTDQTCMPEGTCCTKRTCAGTFAGKCGTSLFDGCAGSLDCACASQTETCVFCPSGQTCRTVQPTEAGGCCTNTNSCGNTCDHNITNSCTGATSACSCSGNSYCNNGTCTPRSTCSTFTTGAVGQPCSDYNYFNDGTGTKFSCPCTSPYHCKDDGTPQAPAQGTCCQDSPAQSCGNQCNTSVTRCDGQTVQCTCGTGSYCDLGDNTCKPLATCAQLLGQSPTHAGDACSDFAMFDAGGGNMISCPCSSGLLCGNDGTQQSPQQGQCCTAGVCNNRCSVNAQGQRVPFVLPQCDGSSTSCTCASGRFCDAAPGTDGTCKRCRDLTPPANGAIGDPCGTFGSSTNTISCACTTSGTLANNRCVSGTCQCTPTTNASCAGRCRNAAVSDGCGGNFTCGCQTGEVCNNIAADGWGACCLPNKTQCAANDCGTLSNGCGGTLSCTCANPFPNTQCVSNHCVCTPNTCAQLGAGVHNDGCGGTINCSA